VSGGYRSVAESDLPSREVAAPCRVFNLEKLAPALLRRSPHALYLFRPGYRVFALQVPGESVKVLRDPLMGFRSSSEVAQAPSRRLQAAPPLRFLPLQRLPTRSSGINWPGLHFPTACAFRFSQPPGAFIRSEPAGLVSCRIRSWGYPPELSSSRAAVRRFQRRYPLGVRTAFRVFAPRESPPLAVQRFRLRPSA